MSHPVRAPSLASDPATVPSPPRGAKPWGVFLGAALILCAAGCSPPSPKQPSEAQAPSPNHSTPATQLAPGSQAPTAVSSGLTAVVIGDSLAEGLGVSAEEAFPAVLERLLRARGKPIAIVNAGISGSRSSSALSRTRWALRSRPTWILLELGANDALQGGDLGELRKNLEAAIREAQSAGVFVLLVGMRAPPNLGKRYCEEFDRIYPDLARRLKVPLVPFVLEGVAGIAALNQGDMRHPNPQGQLRVAENILKHWEPYL